MTFFAPIPEYMDYPRSASRGKPVAEKTDSRKKPPLKKAAPRRPLRGRGAARRVGCLAVTYFRGRGPTIIG
ncbi:MAG: hypothetical protein LBG78_06900, partial [Azoarcus sp.]|nr:hypothetical protein [Azoarcus sp.]